MKKALTLALAALAVSALQAITWTETTLSGAQNLDTGLDIGLGQSGTIAIVFTATNQISSNQYVLMFGAQAEGATTSGATAGNTRARVTIFGGSTAGNARARVESDGSSSGTSLYDSYAGGIYGGIESIVAVSISRGSAVGETTTVTINVNGNVTTATFTETDDTAAYTYQIASILQNYGGSSISTDGEVTVYTANEVATAAEIAMLPEPTVLALLALGVAGMALKRKVA